jgi:hypothetical protein
MLPRNKSEKGQALILIVFALVGLLALTGLAMDGGHTFADRRQSQNAADGAALAAALTYQKNVGLALSDPMTNVNEKALAAAAVNGYDGVTSTVTITNVPDTTCPGTGTQGKKFTVTVVSTIKTWFAPLVGVNEVKNTTTAISRACPKVWGPTFDGAAVVGLDPNGTSYDSGNSNAAKWNLTGGGVFANNAAASKNSNSVTFNTPGTCVTAVGDASGFSCTPVIENSPSLKYNYPADIIPLLPPIPLCTGVATTSGGQVHEQLGYENKGSVVSGIEHDYAPGVYCVDDLSGMMTLHGATIGTGVTLYIRSTDFTIKFNGGGYIGITAPTSGPYAGVAMFSNVTTTPCTQNMEFRGNGSTMNKGTIFLPSACIDFRGNSNGALQRTQLIGYDVTSNGNAGVAINFSPDDNYIVPTPDSLELVK